MHYTVMHEERSLQLATDADLKGDLEEAARRERVSVARLLERIAREWLKTQPSAAEDDEAEQARRHAIAMQSLARSAAAIRIWRKRRASGCERVS